jgi:hypothetical protein
MIAFTLFLLDWWLLLSIIVCAPWPWWPVTFVMWLSIGRERLRAWPWLRSTRLSDWLRTYLYRMKCSMPRELEDFASREQLVGDRPAIFAVEPHGYQCTAISMLFCGYGTRDNLFLSTFGREFLDNTRIVVHWVHNFFPFIGILFRLFGTISNHRLDVELALSKNQNIVLIPSGLAGKLDAVSRPAESNSVYVARRSDARYGFLALAVRHDAVVVPILVPDEPHVYTPIAGMAWLPEWLQPMRETWVLRGVTAPMRVLIGAPIDSRNYSKRTIENFASDYYAALGALARANGSIFSLE